MMDNIGDIVKVDIGTEQRTISAKGKYDDGIMSIAFIDNNDMPLTVVLVGNVKGEHVVGPNSLIQAFGKLFLVTSASNIYVSDDVGASWQLSNNALTSTPYQWIKQIGDELFAASEDVLVKSKDQGLTWDYVELLGSDR